MPTMAQAHAHIRTAFMTDQTSGARGSAVVYSGLESATGQTPLSLEPGMLQNTDFSRKDLAL